jgi:hypothetical protein
MNVIVNIILQKEVTKKVKKMQINFSKVINKRIYLRKMIRINIEDYQVGINKKMMEILIMKQCRTAKV